VVCSKNRELCHGRAIGAGQGVGMARGMVCAPRLFRRRQCCWWLVMAGDGWQLMRVHAENACGACQSNACSTCRHHECHVVNT
jgi:hypothetical protein